MDTEVGERLHVVGLVALVGELTVQANVTVPVNESAGVTEITEVLPLVAPGVTVMLLALDRVKLVLLPLFGACQKFPHPARSGAAANNSVAQMPIFIAAPCPCLPGLIQLAPLTHARPAIE
jgi:hypothetical protein